MLHLLITLILVGFLLWFVNQFVPMDSKIKNILNIVIVIAVIFWLLKVFGILSYLNLNYNL